jgi:hypothetical protein
MSAPDLLRTIVRPRSRSQTRGECMSRSLRSNDVRWRGLLEAIGSRPRWDGRPRQRDR